MKRITAIATAIALPLALSACGPTDNNQTPLTNEPGGSSFEGSTPSDTMSPNPEPQGTMDPNPGDAAAPGAEGATVDPNASTPGTGDQGAAGQP